MTGSVTFIAFNNPQCFGDYRRPFTNGFTIVITKSPSVSCIESGGLGFIRCTFKPLKETNGVFTILPSSKKLVNQFVQVARESSLHWLKKCDNATFRSQDLGGNRQTHGVCDVLIIYIYRYT